MKLKTIGGTTLRFVLNVTYDGTIGQITGHVRVVAYDV